MQGQYIDSKESIEPPPRPSRRMQRVPPQQFQVLFHSLFKVLFTFPSRYLCAIGLDAVFSFAGSLTGSFELHSQATRLCESMTLHEWSASIDRVVRDCHPPWYVFPDDLDSITGHQTTCSPETTTRTRGTISSFDSKSELFPLHSPLLRESLLFSFPPGSDMLKFPGSLYLI